MEKEEKFKALYVRLYSNVFRLCKGYFCGNESLALDAVQEIFLKVWENLDHFRYDAQLSTWVYRISVNVCLLHLRTARRHKKIDVSTYLHVHSNTDSAQDNSKIEALYRSIGKLDEVNRSIAIMILEGLSYTEMANILGMKEATLRVKIHRIRKQLMKEVSNENEY